MLDNFRFFALQYLNDWFQYDRIFVEGLASKDHECRIITLRQAAQYYGVARNFKTLASETAAGNRLSAALNALEQVAEQFDGDRVDDEVDRLAARFKSTYKKYLVSAASKFLWLKFQSPVVIYDNRALNTLRNVCGEPLTDDSYSIYRTAWRRQFQDHEDAIGSTCHELHRAKPFSLAHAQPDTDFSTLVNQHWFHERVFDKYLWWHGGNESVGKSRLESRS